MDRMLSTDRRLERPKRAPFPMGARVRYPGPDYRPEGAPWVRAGDIGVVVKTTRGMADPGDGYGAYHGASVIEFHNDPRCHRAVSADRLERVDGSRYERVG